MLTSGLHNWFFIGPSTSARQLSSRSSIQLSDSRIRPLYSFTTVASIQVTPSCYLYIQVYTYWNFIHRTPAHSINMIFYMIFSMIFHQRIMRTVTNMNKKNVDSRHRRRLTAQLSQAGEYERVHLRLGHQLERADCNVGDGPKPPKAGRHGVPRRALVLSAARSHKSLDLLAKGAKTKCQKTVHGAGCGAPGAGPGRALSWPQHVAARVHK
jgi:hypothetical protein